MTQFEIDMKCGEVHSNSPYFKKKESEALDSLLQFFSITKKPYLALSWGKQSIIVAHMVYRIRPETPMLFLRSWESFHLHDFESVSRDFMQRWPINYVECFRDNVSWNTWTWQETRDYGSNDLQSVGDNCPDWDGVIMGLSKDESKARRITTSLNTTEWRSIFKYKSGNFRCTPIQDWRKNDLAAYLHKYQIPVLTAYKIDGLEARTTARITRDNAEMNGLKVLKERNITGYNLIVKRFPELSIR